LYVFCSSELKCEMKFSVYLPPQAESEKVPVLYFLSGLTCTEQNFMIKGEARRYASEEGIMIVGPDTSPRGCNIEGENDSYDFGSGAGFYVDATEEKWKTHYRMYSYITKELPAVIQSNFPVIADRQSIMGHSMGGHGALICTLKNPGFYKEYDSCELVKKYNGPPLDILIDQDYDHSYYFISTFMGDHVKHHTKYLKA
ncbi:hypothetical protein QZH41_016701, partial [Actinostola sp. cb2023]